MTFTASLTRIKPSVVNRIEHPDSDCSVAGGFSSFHMLPLTVLNVYSVVQRMTSVREMWVSCQRVSCTTWGTSRHLSSLPLSTLTYKLLSHCSSRSYSSQQVGNAWILTCFCWFKQQILHIIADHLPNYVIFTLNSYLLKNKNRQFICHSNHFVTFLLDWLS